MTHPTDDAELRRAIYSMFAGIQKVRIHKHGDFIDYTTHHSISVDERTDRLMALIKDRERQAQINVLKPIDDIHRKLGEDYGELDAQEDIEAYVDKTLAQLTKQNGGSDESS